MSRLPVKKTYKLFVGGEFPRSESGRTYEAEGQNVARASRKDARDAVQAARAAFPKWAGATPPELRPAIFDTLTILQATLPVDWSSYTPALAYLGVIAIFLLRPQGLISRQATRV